MPQINVRGITTENFLKINNELINKLVDLTGTNKEDFTVEVFKTDMLFEDKVINNYPFIEVCWFDRGQKIQDEVAKTITKMLSKIGIEEADLFFTHLTKNNYYYNGKHF
jgi:hypothetical protein